MRSSFRLQLAARFTIGMALATGALGAACVLALRSFLDRELDGNMVEVATIQGAAATDSPTGAMHFHEWELTPGEAASVRDLIRFAQIWSESGQSLLRSRFMSVDLPLDREALAEAGRGALVWREQTFGGVPVRSLFYPLARFGAAHERHVIQIAAPLVTRNALVRRVLLFFVLVTVVVSGASFGGSWWLAGRAVRPIHQVIDQAEAIGAGSLDRRIYAYADTREYHRLVAVLNTMLGRIQHAFDAQHRFAADASHELRSPLTSLRGEIELALRRDRAPDEYRRVLASALEEIVRLSRITEDLLLLARLDDGAIHSSGPPANVGGIVKQIADRLRSKADEKGTQLVVEADPDAIAAIDPGLCGQMTWNLLDNALKFTPAGGVVLVYVGATEQELTIAVTDTGPGLGKDPERLFDRFVTSDPARTPGVAASGTGLGLAIVKAIAQGCRGRVEVATVPTGGARVSVVIPAAIEGMDQRTDGLAAASEEI